MKNSDHIQIVEGKLVVNMPTREQVSTKYVDQVLALYGENIEPGFAAKIVESWVIMELHGWAALKLLEGTPAPWDEIPEHEFDGFPKPDSRDIEERARAFGHRRYGRQNFVRPAGAPPQPALEVLRQTSADYDREGEGSRHADRRKEFETKDLALQSAALAFAASKLAQDRALRSAANRRSCDTVDVDNAFDDLLDAAKSAAEVETQFGAYADEDKRMVGENAQTRNNSRANLREYAFAFAAAELETEFADDIEAERAGGVGSFTTVCGAADHLKRMADPLQQLLALTDKTKL